MATRRRSGSASRRKTAKDHPILRSLLTILIVLLSLAAIAFAASYVYLRQASKKETAKEITALETSPVSEMETDTATSGNQIQYGMSNSSDKQLLDGTWISTANGAMMTIKGENFNIDFPSVEFALPMKGNVKSENGTVRFVNTNPDDECGMKEGLYTFRLDGEDLYLKLKKDGCRSRTTQLATKWYRL